MDLTGKHAFVTGGSGFTGGNPYAPGGAQVAFLQQTGRMSQSFTLAAGSYCLCFDAAQRAKLMEIADKCPVHRTLTSEVRILSRTAD